MGLCRIVLYAPKKLEILNRNFAHQNSVKNTVPALRQRNLIYVNYLSFPFVEFNIEAKKNKNNKTKFEKKTILFFSLYFCKALINVSPGYIYFILEQHSLPSCNSQKGTF